MNDKPRLKVYYNSACPVCKAGIEGQKTKESRCDIQWNDVHRHHRLAAEVATDLERVRERLHVVDEHGELQIGFDAFLALWRNSPAERWKAGIFGLPGVRQLGRLGYNLFAAALYKWNRANRRW